MATITALSFVITSSYDGAGMTRARRAIDDMNSSTKSLHSVLTPFNSTLRTMSVVATGLGPALIPAAGAVAGLAGGFAAATVAAGAAAGIFGGALFGAITKTISAYKDSENKLLQQKKALAQLTPGTKAYEAQLKKVNEAQKVLNDTINSLTPAQHKFYNSIGDMTSAWATFIESTEKDTLTPTSIAMDAVSRNMQKFVPIVHAVSPLITKVAKDFANWMDGSGLDRFIATIQDHGVPILGHFIDIGKSVITVLGRGFRDFLPLGEKIVKAIAEGAKKLQGWASGGGFQKFIAYVTDHGSELKGIFKSLVTILGNVSSSMSDTSDASITIVGILTNLLSMISPDMLTAITYAWIGWNLALEAYAIYATAAAVASVILATATSPFLLLILGAALTILGVVAALAALGTAIYFIVKYWDDISSGLVTAWDAVWGFIKDTAQTVWDFLTNGWGQLCLFFMGPLGLVILLWKHWDQVWAAIQVAAQVVWDALKTGWDAFTGWISDAWNTVWPQLLQVWHDFIDPIVSIWNTVWAGLLTAWHGFIDPVVESWNTVWPQMKEAGENIWNAITAAWDFMWSLMTAAWSAFSGWFSSSSTAAWQQLSDIATAAWGLLTAAWQIFWNTFGPIFTTAWQGLVATATAVWSLLTAAWNLVWTIIRGIFDVAMAALSGIWSVTWTALTGIAQIAWAILTGAWQVVWAVIRGIWDVFYAAFSGIFMTAWNTLVALATGIWNVIKAAWDALWKVITAIFLTFTAIFTGNWGLAWNAIKDAGLAIWNVIKALWQTFLNTVSALLGGFISTAKAVWSAFWTAVQSVATTFWNALKNLFQVTLTAIQALWTSIWNAVKTFFQTLVNSIVAIAQAAWSTLRAAINAFLTGVTSIWNTTWTAIRTFFQTISTGIQTIASAMWKAVEGIFTSWSNWVRTTFWNPVSNFFTKTIPSAFDSAKTAIGKAWDGIKKLVRDPIQAIVNVVYNNGIVKLWNAVAGVFGAKKLGTFTLPAFAKGGPTGGGSQKGFPAIVHPNEHVWTSAEVKAAGGHKEVAKLRAMALGTGPGNVRVMGGPNGRFDDGGGIFGTGFGPDVGPDVVGAVSSVVGKLKDVVLGGVYKVIEGPINAAVKAAQSAVRGLTPAGSGIRELGEAIPKKIGDTVLSWIKGKDVAPAGSGGTLVGAIPKGAHLSIINAALKAAGVPPPGTLAQWQKGLNTLITRESGWNPNAQNNWDSNAAAGMSSRGLAQVIPPTFASNHVAGTSSNIFDPVANVAAAIRYITRAYGNITNVQQADASKPPKGYAIGTPGANSGWAWVGERGPERVRFRGGERVDPLSTLVGSGGRGGDIKVNVPININGRADHGVVDRLERETIPKLTMAIKQGVGRRP